MDPAVSLVESYLRLNGYFTTTGFHIQHPNPAQSGDYVTATEVDILAVRFPWAAGGGLSGPRGGCVRRRGRAAVGHVRLHDAAG